MIIKHKGHSQYFKDPDYDSSTPDDEEIPDDEDNGNNELALSPAQAQAAHKLCVIDQLIWPAFFTSTNSLDRSTQININRLRPSLLMIQSTLLPKIILIDSDGFISLTATD
ncbi:hypothetical protein MJO28_010567 [Puccinia striiformis f. sp. tritici]|uniref:Uncharacterized protein n=1 Tax=Puccinia striiformis f. sp. tritici TaxID=168172 RepID=A0ACC0E5A2_9BASI|nr:hypothetical protein MJO28_010567 [Puccinia striiformis f. sp. tritici]KAI7948643.1 hypothetical protein MJO29_010308 [Puccinia striiformis f. sp. tritici]